MSARKYRVRCMGHATGKLDGCGWSGVRVAAECECYDMPCQPTAPGWGCPSGVVWPCPRCKGKVFGRAVQHRSRAGVTS